MLTEFGVRAIQPPEMGAKIYLDGTVPGFGVRVTATGTKSYVLTHGRTRIRETIGRVGILDLKEARVEAKRRLATYTLGKTKIASVGWNWALERYLDGIKAKRKATTHTEYGRLLKTYFKFGDTKLDEITPGQVQKKLDHIRGSERFHAFTVLRAFLNWCNRRHYFDVSPVARMEKPEGSKARARVLADEELKKIWNACGDDTFGRIVKLLILTGQRRGEISKLQGNMIGDDRITFPSWLTKNGREHTLPIGELSVLTLSLTKPSKTLVFPARGNISRAFNGFSKSKATLDERSGVTDWTLHDLRRTFASGLAARGVALPVVEKLLNHVSGSFGGIVGVYQRYDFFPEMKDAVAKWEMHLKEVLAIP